MIAAYMRSMIIQSPLTPAAVRDGDTAAAPSLVSNQPRIAQSTAPETPRPVEASDRSEQARNEEPDRSADRGKVVDVSI